MPGSMKIACLLKSLIIAYVVTGLLLLAIACALYKLGLSENLVNILITGVYVISAFAGGMVCGKQIREKRFLWGLMLGICYELIIVIVSSLANKSLDISSTYAIYQMCLAVGGGMLGGMFS